MLFSSLPSSTSLDDEVDVARTWEAGEDSKQVHRMPQAIYSLRQTLTHHIHHVPATLVSSELVIERFLVVGHTREMHPSQVGDTAGNRHNMYQSLCWIEINHKVFSYLP